MLILLTVDLIYSNHQGLIYWTMSTQAKTYRSTSQLTHETHQYIQIHLWFLTWGFSEHCLFPWGFPESYVVFHISSRVPVSSSSSTRFWWEGRCCSPLANLASFSVTQWAQQAHHEPFMRVVQFWESSFTTQSFITLAPSHAMVFL